MSTAGAIFALLAITLIGGIVWYERSQPPAQVVALVAALAALAAAGRIALSPIPNVVPTTDITLIAGFALGGAPGFAVGALAALASNFWLGQGPWTPWQMAGWGMAGLLGAGLAVLTGRRLGRVGLAVACGVVGFAYGALLDLYTMVSFGGEQSLDRYLVLSARGLPFNVAHAAGNVAFALIAGPALVRMLTRYRTRFEFAWKKGAAPAGASLLLLLGAVVALAGTASPPARDRRRREHQPGRRPAAADQGAGGRGRGRLPARRPERGRRLRLLARRPIQRRDDRLGDPGAGGRRRRPARAQPWRQDAALLPALDRGRARGRRRPRAHHPRRQGRRAGAAALRRPQPGQEAAEAARLERLLGRPGEPDGVRRACAGRGRVWGGRALRLVAGPQPQPTTGGWGFAPGSEQRRRHDRGGAAGAGGRGLRRGRRPGRRRLPALDPAGQRRVPVGRAAAPTPSPRPGRSRA